MHVDPLNELRTAFESWRNNKRYAREPMPEHLLARARRATKKHGVTAVVRATRVQRDRLFRDTRTRAKQGAVSSSEPQALPTVVPTYSRLELSPPSSPSSRPIAEVETDGGVTLRVFELTPQMMELLSAVCGIGGVR